MEGYKYEVQVELTPGDPVISAQVCLERKWGTQGNLNTNTATVTSLDVWSDIFFYFEFGSLSVQILNFKSPVSFGQGLADSKY